MAKTLWTIDPAHSEIQFKARHLMITTVTGSFTTFTGSVETTDEDFAAGKASFTAQVASITTGNEQRDGHLKSDDFFNAEKFPVVTFTSTKIEKSGEGYTMTGPMTIRDVTKPVTLTVDFNGIAKDPWGNTKAGFELSGKVSRKDFQLNWNAVTEAGGVVVSDEIKLLVNAQLVKS